MRSALAFSRDVHKGSPTLDHLREGGGGQVMTIQGSEPQRERERARERETEASSIQGLEPHTDRDREKHAHTHASSCASRPRSGPVRQAQQGVTLKELLFGLSDLPHRYGFTEATMKRALQAVGFVGIYVLADEFELWSLAFKGVDHQTHGGGGVGRDPKGVEGGRPFIRAGGGSFVEGGGGRYGEGGDMQHEAG
jgi:hypothetical protein